MILTDEEKRHIAERRKRLRGVAVDGEVVRVPMLLADTAIRTTERTMNISDAMQSVPGEYRSKMLYWMGQLKHDSAGLPNAIDQARKLARRMRMTSDGVYGGHFVSDAQKPATMTCADHLEGAAAAAEARLNRAGH